MIERVWFKIGEAATRVGATPKELRYWEKVIPELQPRRSKGNLRYYHQEEIARLQRIRQWLAEGCTVADCRLRLQGLPISAAQNETEPTAAVSPSRLGTALQALRKVLGRLSVPPGSLPPIDTEELPDVLRPLARPRKATVKAVRVVAVVPGPPALPLESETPSEASEIPPESAAKRSRKPKPEASALGRMWSVTRLPLDLDE